MCLWTNANQFDKSKTCKGERNFNEGNKHATHTSERLQIWHGDESGAKFESQSFPSAQCFSLSAASLV